MPTVTSTETTIHWGKVLKGAAIVATAVVAAAVVAYAAPILLDQIGGLIETGGTFDQLLATVIDAGKEFAGWLSGKADWAWAGIKEFWIKLPGMLGLTKQLSDVATTTSAIKSGLTTGVTIAAAAAAVPAAAHVLKHTDFVSRRTTSRMVPDASIAKRTGPDDSWASRVGGSSASTTQTASHADSVRASKPVENTYAEQMKAETVALDKALAK